MTTSLLPEEYDASYFDGASQALRHNAGYSKYERWKRHDGESSSGEYWKDKAKDLVKEFNLKGKKTLELGCAKGFLVHDMLGMGVNAFGLDVSEYAAAQAETDKVKDRIFLGDARTDLSQFQDNEFDVVFSLRFLECIAEEDISVLVTQINRISKAQFHETDKEPNSLYYLKRNVDDLSFTNLIK